jgi:hypothetical protein
MMGSVADSHDLWKVCLETVRQNQALIVEILCLWLR